jgi:hypothetical protein
MKIGIAVLLCSGMLALATAQEKLSAGDGVPPLIGLEIGQHAPAFALPDQCGHEQSNETVKVAKRYNGTSRIFLHR